MSQPNQENCLSTQSKPIVVSQVTLRQQISSLESGEDWIQLNGDILKTVQIRYT